VSRAGSGHHQASPSPSKHPLLVCPTTRTQTLEQARLAAAVAAAAAGQKAAIAPRGADELVVRCDAFIGLVSKIDFFARKLNFTPKPEILEDDKQEDFDVAATPTQPDEEDQEVSVQG
jgi:hypothetical protein